MEAISSFLWGHGIRHGFYVKDYRGSVGQTKDQRLIVTTRELCAIQCASREAVTTWLTGMRPYLFVKKVKCEDALRYLALYPYRKGKRPDLKYPDVTKAVLEADYAMGLSYDRIAKKHGMSISCVVSRLHPEKTAAAHKRYRKKKQQTAA
jgi:hypothetical protein